MPDLQVTSDLGEAIAFCQQQTLGKSKCLGFTSNGRITHIKTIVEGRYEAEEIGKMVKREEIIRKAMDLILG